MIQISNEYTRFLSRSKKKYPTKTLSPSGIIQEDKIRAHVSITLFSSNDVVSSLMVGISVER
jgi:hypothetical protein